MRESYLMERHAQRAVDKRRTEEEANRKLGNWEINHFLAEGKLLEDCLKKLKYIERLRYITANSELIVSSDNAEGINVVWGPNSQVLTHRILSLAMRSEFRGAHYLGSWVRKIGPHQRDMLRAQLVSRLESRVVQRKAQQNQIAIDFEDDVDGIPLFLQSNG